MPPESPALNSASLRVSAAMLFHEARVKDFDAALMVGSKAELERARIGAIAAFEAVLDAKQNVTWLLLKGMGIDPEGRP